MANQNQYLYRLLVVRPAMLTEGPTPEEQQVVRAHFAYLEALLEEGKLILAGRTLNNDYSTFGIVLFVANDDAEAREIVDKDPAVVHRVMRGELYPYRIALFRPPENL